MPGGWNRRGWTGHGWKGSSWHGKGWPPTGWKHQKRWGLRRRLTFAFAFVALAAVSLTTWLTLGAVFSAQQDLFHADPGGFAADSRFAAAREAFRQITRTAFLAGLLSFLLASMAAAVFTRFLTRPLLALTDGALRLATGERGLRLRVPAQRDELRTLTEAFNNLVAGLERQEAWRRDLVADIAHDLRTPLAVLRSEIEAMQDGISSLDAAGLERLHGEVLMLTRLVEDLRTLSLAEGGNLPLHLETTPVHGLLERARKAFANAASECGVTLELAPVDPGLNARLDPGRIGQVLNNLIDNALRYAAPGRVILGAGAIPDGVRLWVRDHGPGLPEEALERVFERFYRGDRSRTREGSGSGSGLGLAIARAIAEAHGGGLEAENHPDGGAVFDVLLPERLPDPVDSVS